MVQTPNGYSIVMIFFEERSRIAASLDALIETHDHFAARQSLPVEFIFVNNGKDDETLSMVEKFIRERCLTAVVLTSPKNNMGMARNMGLAKAKYGALIYLDADCKPEPGWLLKYHDLYSTLRSARLGAVGGENSPPLDPKIRLYRLILQLKQFPMLHLNSTQVSRASKLVKVRHVPTCNVLYVRSALLEIGGFNDSYVRVGEDLEVSMRLQKQGCDLFFSDGINVEHRHKTSFISWFQKVFGYGSAQPRILLKYPFGAGIARWIPILILLWGLAGLILYPTLAVLVLVGCSVFIPMFGLVFYKAREFPFSWVIFLNGTVVSYLLGYLVGFVRMPLLALKRRNAEG